MIKTHTKQLLADTQNLDPVNDFWIMRGIIANEMADLAESTIETPKREYGYYAGTFVVVHILLPS